MAFGAGCLLGNPALAAVEIVGMDDIVIDAWAGATGNLTGYDDYCVRSYQGNSPRNYNVAAYQGAAAGSTTSAFRMVHTNNTNTMSVTFNWSNNANSYTMTNYNVTGYVTPAQTGAVNCTDTAADARIDITIPSAQLATAIAGTYSATMQIDLLGGRNFGQLTIVTFQVTLPETIEVTRLNDIPLGTWDSVNDIVATEDFCVFRNGQGDFSLTATSGNPSGTQFRFSGADDLDYELDFRQAGAWHAADSGTPMPSATTGFTGESTRDCGSGTNTTARVTVEATKMATANAGAFSDTVTILVAPD